MMRAKQAYVAQVDDTVVTVYRGQFAASGDALVLAAPDEWEELPGQGDGGSQPVKVVRFSIAWDTPNLAAPNGVPIPGLGAGDLVWFFFMSVTEAFNGTAPYLYLGVMTDGTIDYLTGSLAADSFDVSLANTVLLPSDAQDVNAHSDTGSWLLGNDPVGVILTSNAPPYTDAPGSTQGAADIVILAISPFA